MPPRSAAHTHGHTSTSITSPASGGACSLTHAAEEEEVRKLWAANETDHLCQIMATMSYSKETAKQVCTAGPSKGAPLMQKA